MSQPTALRKRITKRCEQCGGDYQCRADQPSQRFCSRRCKGDWLKAQPRRHTEQVIRRLRDDEPIPPGEPSRYKAGNGYIVLRWKVGVRHYVDVLEHRYVTGRISPEVHHINGIRDDNRPENLMPVTSTTHGEQHATWDIEAACGLYREGWSLPRLASHFGKDTTRILRALRLRGVQMRSLKEARQLRDSQRVA